MPFTKKDIDELIEFTSLLKVRRWIGIRYQNIALIGFLCLVFVFFNLKNSFIPIKDLIISCGVTSLIISTVFLNFYKRELGIFWAYFHNLTLGFILVYLLILSNDLFSIKKTIYNDYYIDKLELKYKDEHRKGSYLVPIITVNIDGKERRISLSTYDIKDSQKTRYVRLGIKDGFWDYPILKDIQLIINNKTVPNNGS